MTEDLAKLLDPEILRGNLITSALYIAAYETCKESIISKPRSFFTDFWDKDGGHPNDDYRKKVLSLARSPLEATLLWVQSLGGIDQSDVESFSKVREMRNRVVHDLPAFLSEQDREIDSQVFQTMLEVTHKIGVWWVINVEITTDPEYDGEEVDESEVQTGTILLLQMMMDIALGNEPEEGYYYSRFKDVDGDA